MNDKCLLQWIYTLIGGLFSYLGIGLIYSIIFYESIPPEEWTIQNSVGIAYADAIFEAYYFEFIGVGVLLLIIGIAILFKNRKVWLTLFKRNRI